MSVTKTIFPLVNCVSNTKNKILIAYNRLLSLSALETSPTQGTWEKAKNMELERKRRLVTDNRSQEMQ